MNTPAFKPVPNAPMVLRGAWEWPYDAAVYAVLMNREEATVGDTWTYNAITCADGWTRILISDNDGEPVGWL